MQTVQEALRIILGEAPVLSSERVGLSEITGRVLAKTHHAERSLPPTDNSAMDGYGVRACDLASASEGSPVSLEVIGVALPGGASPPQIVEGQATRITTGAPIPPGVDTVVMREKTDESMVEGSTGVVRVLQAPRAGDHIRRRGEDVAEGEVVGERGQVVHPARLNLLAAAGHVEVEVTRRPVVAVISSGDELKELGAPLGPGDIVNSNAHALVAAIERAGGRARLIGIARDTLEDHMRLIEAARSADVLLTIGGVSMGTHDFVRPAFDALGVDLSFWKVAMRPGKPLAFGRRDAQLVFGLPGNPVSSLVGFELFVRPTLRRMQGCESVIRRELPARLCGPGMKKRRDLTYYVRAHAQLVEGGLEITLEAKQSSGQISGIAGANALCVLPAGTDSVEEGDRVDVLLLHDEVFFGPGEDAPCPDEGAA